MDARKPGIESHRLSKLFYRFRQKTRLSIGPAEEHTKLRPVPQLLYHAVVKLLGRHNFALLQVSQTERVSHIVILWRQPQRRL